jgi:hypothetical protein
VTKNAKTANTIRRLTHMAFDDPARSNADFGLRIASTIAHTAMVIAARRARNKKRVQKKSRIGYEALTTKCIA